VLSHDSFYRNESRAALRQTEAVTYERTIELTFELHTTLVELARTPRLLVACDYDGVLAPIVEDPAATAPLPESVSALRSLSGLPETAVAVISGRALRDLAVLTRLPAEVHLVGSHGSEFDGDFEHELPQQAKQLRARLIPELERIAAGNEGVLLEKKPASVTVHVRRARPDVAERVLAAVREGPCGWDGVQVTEGKAVIELAVVRTDKGEALDIVRDRVGATAAVFVGDDVTDEKAFRRLRGADVGIKVGDGDTAASQRVTDPTQVATALELLLRERRNWLNGRLATGR
jgi:trehalose 6-phosphate phosphatase